MEVYGEAAHGAAAHGAAAAHGLETWLATVIGDGDAYGQAPYGMADPEAQTAKATNNPATANCIKKE